MSDAEKVHRWITQAELDAMLEAARSQGRQEAIEDSPTMSQYWDAIHGAKMLEDEARTAYQRGAEAMREAAAGVALERARYWTETSASEGGVTSMDDRAEEARFTADDIRALPVPEDKP